MGKLILENAVQALTEGGIPARRAMPSGTLPQITETVAAVALKAMDTRNQKVTVLATLLTPAELGSSVCEETAMEAAQILSELGGECTLGGCGFDGRNGLFTLEVTAKFNSAVPKVWIDDAEMKHVLAFTSWRTLDEEVTTWSKTKWNFRLEEYFPMGDEEDASPAGEFTLVHVSEIGTESYINSTWTYQRRIWDASGVRQVRLGVAEVLDMG